VKPRHYAMLAIGLVWFVADLWIVQSRTILRETSLGVVAEFLDRLPPRLGNLIFDALWIVLLLGWAIPAGFGVRPMFRGRNSN